jgi:hypothetical protein
MSTGHSFARRISTNLERFELHATPPGWHQGVQATPSSCTKLFLWNGKRREHVDECIFEVCLPYVFAWAVIGFYYFILVSTGSRIMKVLMNISFGPVILDINMTFWSHKSHLNDFPRTWGKGNARGNSSRLNDRRYGQSPPVLCVCTMWYHLRLVK